MIKIVLADDQKIFLDGLQAILENYEDIEVIGEALNGDKVMEILAERSADIVLLDIDMPDGMDGIETTKAIKRLYKNTKVLILSYYADKTLVLKMIDYGASGYILKNKAKEELLMAIYNLAAGKTHFGIDIMNHATSTSYYYEDEAVKLSQREIEIMKKLTTGYSAKDTAVLMGISKLTVDKHRQNIYIRLGIKNIVELTHYAIKHKYIEIQ